MKKVKKYGTHFPQNKSAILSLNPDPDPSTQFAAYPCESGFATMIYAVIRRGVRLTTERDNDSICRLNDSKEMKLKKFEA